MYGTLLPAAQDWKQFTYQATPRNSIILLCHKILSQTHIFVQMELTAQVYAGPKFHAHDPNLHHKSPAAHACLMSHHWLK